MRCFSVHDLIIVRHGHSVGIVIAISVCLVLYVFIMLLLTAAQLCGVTASEHGKRLRAASPNWWYGGVFRVGVRALSPNR